MSSRKINPIVLWSLAIVGILIFALVSTLVKDTWDETPVSPMSSVQDLQRKPVRMLTDVEVGAIAAQRLDANIQVAAGRITGLKSDIEYRQVGIDIAEKAKTDSSVREVLDLVRKVLESEQDN